MVNADYVWITGDAFTDMRLLIEGAIVLYEEDAGDIMRLLRGEKNREVRYAVNTIGAALYHLREHIKKLEMAHCQQVESEVEESKETSVFTDRKSEPEKRRNRLKNGLIPATKLKPTFCLQERTK